MSQRSMPPPLFGELTFSEKMLVAKLHSQMGDNWRAIARHVRKPVSLLKTYWRQKIVREEALRAIARDTKIYLRLKSRSEIPVCRRTDPFTWPLIPVTRHTTIAHLIDAIRAEEGTF